ncbi:MAG: hypothetical protein NT173_07600 [Opitutales bacterium]|nr:hypothetical protein [Opitutales bacterium]
MNLCSLFPRPPQSRPSRSRFLLLLAGLGSSLPLLAGTPPPEPPFLLQAERPGWQADPNAISVGTLAKICSGQFKDRETMEFAYFSGYYTDSKPLGSPLKLTVNGNSWDVGLNLNLTASLSVVLGQRHKGSGSRGSLAGLSEIHPKAALQTSTLSFPGLRWNGPGLTEANGLEFHGEIEGGVWLDVVVYWNAGIDGGWAPTAYLDQERALRENAARAYLPKIQAEVLAYLQQVRINPQAYVTTEVAAPKVVSLLEFATDPAGKQSLRADGKDGVYVKARALPAPGEKPESVAARTQAITFASAGPAKAWVDFGAPAVDGPWKKVYLQASNPDKVRGSAIPPPAVELQATLKTAEQTLTKSLTLALTPNPTIDAKPDLVEFTLQSGQTAEVKVSLENPGPEKWQFRTEYEPTSRALAKAAIKATDASQAVLTLKEAGLEALHDGSNTEYATLRILAEQKDREPLERDIKVAVAQEGLFVASTGRDAQTRRFNVTADGKASPRDIDFRIFAQDPTSKRILNLTKNPATLAQVTVECLEDPASLAGRLIAAGQLTWKLAGLRSSNQPSAILRLACARELPSDGRTVPCDFRITYTGGQDESFSALVTVGLVTTANGPGGRDWQIELEKCQTIIRKFVPAAYQPKMRELLDRRKQTLGPEGLHALRERIWVAAAELTLGEGGRGYADEARWANYITESLEWTQWAGDLAFTAAIGTVTGPYGAMGASSLKGMILSALTAYQDGQTPEEWLWGNLSTIPGILEGKVIDPDTFEQLGMQHKAKIWAVFVSYHFLKNLYQGQTVVESLKSTAKEVAGNLLGSWLGTEVKKNGQRAAGGWAVDKVKGAASTLASAAKGGKAVPPAKPAAAPTPAAKPAQPAGKPTPAKAVPVTKETPPSTATKPGTKVSPAAKSSGAGDTGNGSGKAKAPDSPATSSKPSTDTPAEPAPGAAGSTPKAPAPEPTGTKPAAPASKPAEPAGPKTGADPASKPADAGAAPVARPLDGPRPEKCAAGDPGGLRQHPREPLPPARLRACAVREGPRPGHEVPDGESDGVPHAGRRRAEPQHRPRLPGLLLCGPRPEQRPGDVDRGAAPALGGPLLSDLFPADRRPERHAGAEQGVGGRPSAVGHGSLSSGGQPGLHRPEDRLEPEDPAVRQGAGDLELHPGGEEPAGRLRRDGPAGPRPDVRRQGRRREVPPRGAGAGQQGRHRADRPAQELQRAGPGNRQDAGEDAQRPGRGVQCLRQAQGRPELPRPGGHRQGRAHPPRERLLQPGRLHAENERPVRVAQVHGRRQGGRFVGCRGAEVRSRPQGRKH